MVMINRFIPAAVKKKFFREDFFDQSFFFRRLKEMPLEGIKPVLSDSEFSKTLSVIQK